jgi:hypothetical protein
LCGGVVIFGQIECDLALTPPSQTGPNFSKIDFLPYSINFLLKSAISKGDMLHWAKLITPTD